MKASTYFVVLFCLILVVFTSCNFDDNPNTLDNDKVISKSTYGGVVKDEINFDEFSYTLSKPLVSSKGIIDYKEMEMPRKIGDLKMSVYSIFDEQRFLVYLYEDTAIGQDREIGFYDFIINKYETIFTVTLEEGKYNRSVSIWDTDGVNILYKDTIFEDLNDLRGTDTLYVYNIETKKHTKIHDYSDDYADSGAANSNKVVLYEGMVYYDEVEMTNGQLSGINLYKFDLKSETVSLVQDWAQNPTVYDGQLFFVAKYDTSPDFYFQSIDKKTKIKLTKRISDFAPIDTELYTLNNKYLDEETRLTVWNIENLISREELLTSTIAIDQLQGNSKIITWVNFFPEKPVIYIKDIEKFVVFDEFENGYSSYELNEEYCILRYYNDNQAVKYYIFTLK